MEYPPLKGWDYLIPFLEGVFKPPPNLVLKYPALKGGVFSFWIKKLTIARFLIGSQLSNKERLMRSLWKGSISFGLVNIPVHMYTASREKEISFTLLHKKDHSQIRYARICKAEDKEVPWNEIEKAYEFEKGEYVVLNQEDFEKANLAKSKSIEIFSFVEEKEIDTVYYVKPYYLEPDKSAEKAYSLLREALRKSRKVGLAKIVLHNREHVAVIKVHEEMLILNELRYQAELLNSKDLKIPAAKTSGKELDIAIQLIDQLTVPFDPAAYKDTYTEEIKKMIRQKTKGKVIQPKGTEPKATKVHDIMSLLKASLEEKKKPAKRSRKIA